jgi:spoIIIJ-associated protein
MKNYTAKILEDAIEMASKDQGVDPKELVYEVIEEKRGLFKKTATIAVYELSDAITYAENYLKHGLESMGITCTTKTVLKDDIINITLDTNQNSIIIGKDGHTLQALTELTRLATFLKFKKRYRVLLDVNNYKTAKYKKLSFVARKAAKEVLTSKGEIKLDPMPSDERRIVHNALARFPHISSESVGEGKERAVVIKYVA